MDGLEILLAERAIRQVILTYCRGVDRADSDLIRSCYHPGAQDAHGSFHGDGDAFADYIVVLVKDRFESTVHTVHNCTIQFDGDSGAHVETYFVAYHLGKQEPSGEAVFRIFAGRYVDRFELRDASWKITSRVVVRDWSLGRRLSAEEVEREREGAVSYVGGRQDRADLAYPESYLSWLASNAATVRTE